MKKQGKKWLAFLMVSLLLVGLLCGCASTKTDPTGGSAADGTTTTASTTTTTTSDKEMTTTTTNSTTTTTTIIVKEPTSAPTSAPTQAPSASSTAGYVNTPINSENISSFAYCNGNLITTDIRGIVVDFHGLGENNMTFTPGELAQICASKGIVYLYPYDNPWSWMNDLAVRYTDEIIDAVIDKYDLPEDVPIVAAGGSMGGCSALVYTHYAKRTPVACATNCAVCDLPYHYTERLDLPRTIYSAFMHYSGDFTAAMQTASPYHLAATMPKDTTYYIVACEADSAVNIGMHSDRFVAELKKTHDNDKITYIRVPGMGHCMLPQKEKEAYYDFITSDKWFG